MLIEARKATWTEVSTLMSVDDVMDLVEALHHLITSRRSQASDDEYDE